jgi:hypothetical protein
MPRALPLGAAPTVAAEGAVGEQIKLALLNAVVSLTAGAIVEMLPADLGYLRRGDGKL